MRGSHGECHAHRRVMVVLFMCCTADSPHQPPAMAALPACKRTRPGALVQVTHAPCPPLATQGLWRMRPVGAPQRAARHQRGVSPHAADAQPAQQAAALAGGARVSKAHIRVVPSSSSLRLAMQLLHCSTRVSVCGRCPQKWRPECDEDTIKRCHHRLCAVARPACRCHASCATGAPACASWLTTYWQMR